MKYTWHTTPFSAKLPSFHFFFFAHFSQISSIHHLLTQKFHGKKQPPETRIKCRQKNNKTSTNDDDELRKSGIHRKHQAKIFIPKKHKCLNKSNPINISRDPQKTPRKDFDGNFFVVIGFSLVGPKKGSDLETKRKEHLRIKMKRKMKLRSSGSNGERN